MASGVSSSVTGSNTVYPQEAVQLPNDFLISVFKEKVIYALHNLTVFSTVCKQWKECVQSNTALSPAREILERVLSCTKSDTQDNWQWLKENCPSRCEVFFDVNAMRYEHDDQGQWKLIRAKGIDEKIVQVISALEVLCSKVTLWPIYSITEPAESRFGHFANLEQPIFFPGKETIQEVVKRLNGTINVYYGVFSPNWNILASRLSNHQYEEQKFWAKKKLMIVCGSFSEGPPAPHAPIPCHHSVSEVLYQIFRISQYIQQRPNLHLQIVPFTLPGYNNFLNSLAVVLLEEVDLQKCVQILFNNMSLNEIASRTAYVDRNQLAENENVEESSSDESSGEESNDEVKLVPEDAEEPADEPIPSPEHKRRKLNDD